MAAENRLRTYWFPSWQDGKLWSTGFRFYLTKKGNKTRLHDLRMGIRYLCKTEGRAKVKADELLEQEVNEPWGVTLAKFHKANKNGKARRKK